MTNPPSPRIGFAQVYDAKRNIITIFGGDTDMGVSYNETWQADLNNLVWRKIATSLTPEARGQTVGAIDSCHDRMYIYGGASYDAQGYPTLYTDLWEFDLSTLKWTKLNPAGGFPWSFNGGSFVFDAKEHRLLYFGGFDSNFSNLINETWAYSISDNKWVKLATTGTHPSSRAYAGADYNPLKHCLYVLNGCYLATEGTIGWYKPLKELWELDLSTLEWKQIVQNIPVPSERKSMGFNCLPKDNQLILFGGDVSLTYEANCSNALWRFDLATQKWTWLHPDGDQVTARASFVTNFDAVRARILLFGGYNNSYTYHNDLYELLLSPDTEVEAQHESPENFVLFPNYPNPFNPSTTIAYDLPKSMHVRLVIYDMLGRQIRTLVDSHQQAGHFQTNWDGTDERNESEGNGVYLCQMKAGDFIKVIKLTMLR